MGVSPASGSVDRCHVLIGQARRTTLWLGPRGDKNRASRPPLSEAAFLWVRRTVDDRPSPELSAASPLVSSLQIIADWMHTTASPRQC
jgi:hypothetical protein